MPPRAELPPHEPDVGVDPSEEERIVEANIPPEDAIAIALAVMRDHPNDTTSLVRAIQILELFSRQHPAAVLASDAVAQVFTVMTNHGNHEPLLSLSFRFLIRIELAYEETRNAEDAAVLFEQNQVILIVSVMDSFRENEDIQVMGALIFCSIACTGRNMDLFMGTNAITAALTAATKFVSHKKELSAICSAIVNLLEKDIDGRFKEEIEAAGGLFFLVDILKRYGPISLPEDSLVAESLPLACRSIKLLAKDRETVISSIIELDGIEAIVSTMVHQPSNSHLQFDAGWCLHALGRQSNDVTQAFVDADGIRKLIALMKDHLDVSSIAGGVFLAFSGLAKGNPDFADALALEGGLDVMFDSVARYIDEDMVGAAISAIHACVNAKVTQHVEHRIQDIPNALRTIVDALNHYSNSDEGIVCCQVLTHMPLSANMCQDIVRFGGLNALSHVMKRSPSNANISNVCVCLIERMVSLTSCFSETIDLVESIVAAGLVPLILDVLRRPTDNDGLVVKTIACLRAVVEHSTLAKKEIISAEGVDLIRSFQNNRDEDVATKAQMFLEAMEKGVESAAGTHTE